MLALRWNGDGVRLRTKPMCSTVIIGVFAMVGLARGPCPGSGCWDLALFGDIECSVCNVDVPVGHSGDVYVVARSFEPQGILGAEFRIVGLPVGWTHASTPNPTALVALGDPFGPGAIIAFDQAQTGLCILLYHVSLTATSAAENVSLSVAPHTTPTNPSFSCPRITCNCSPVFPIVCVSGQGMTINGSCTVGVQEQTWSSLKALYE